MIQRDGIFRKSGDSDSGGCVEVAGLPGGGVKVRDTKDRDGGTQTYTDHEWRAFLVGAKRGEFDLPD
ncbi:MAG TPA: DUF397 domain-containing protein [Streptosporangiaceae bacterium]